MEVNPINNNGAAVGSIHGVVLTIRLRQIVDEAPVDIGVATKIHAAAAQTAVGGRRRTRRPLAPPPGFKCIASFTNALYLTAATRYLHVPPKTSEPKHTSDVKIDPEVSFVDVGVGC
jgi:hypothetical protein